MDLNQISYVRNVIERIESCLSGVHQFNRSAKADVYDSILSAPSFFPAKVGFIKSDSAFLRREVCATCPSKVKPAKMKEHEATVALKFRSYLSKLKAWLIENDTTPPNSENLSVNDLQSNI